ncbi:MAG: hypothetical protein JWM25_369, partial [Thermoleophilia bacterium]|nr:hypothetical protein [Thermoleophilia bacterium]
VLMSDNFDRPNGLITNEYATYNPNQAGVFKDAQWWSDSGSFFAQNNTGWSGRPDAVAPNINSSTSTNSSIFRLWTKRTTFGDAAIEVDLRVNGLTSTTKTPAASWDGFHVVTRRQSSGARYYVTMNRRDGVMIIKKQTSTFAYCTLTGTEIKGAYSIPIGRWQKLRVTSKLNADGTVTVQGLVDGVVRTSARDTGSMCGAPLREAGSVGLRSDNIDFNVDNFRISAL